MFKFGTLLYRCAKNKKDILEKAPPFSVICHAEGPMV